MKFQLFFPFWLLCLLPSFAFGAKDCGQIFHRLVASEENQALANEVQQLHSLTDQLAKEDPTATELNYLRSLTNSDVEEVRISNRALIAKRKLREKIASSYNIVKNLAKLGAKNWRYIAAVEAVQLGAETYVRWDDFSSANPLVITKEMGTNKELIHNMAYMANETFWMSALSSSPEGHSRSWAEIKHSFKLCAIVALVNANLMSVAIKGEADPGRIALDTGWEMAIGSAQTQIDFAALRAFEVLALRAGAPKLKALGYVAVAIDQGIGYIGYAHATKWYENRARQKEKYANELEAKQVKLIPIYAPESGSSSEMPVP